MEPTIPGLLITLPQASDDKAIRWSFDYQTTRYSPMTKG
jgi:hypothetical protein